MSEKILCFVKDRRERAGLSQLVLAKTVGVSRQALVAIEAGRQVPSTGLSLRLACALGCKVEALFQLYPSERPAMTLAPQGDGTERTALREQSGSGRIAVGRVGARWVAHRVHDESAAADAYLAADAGIEDELTGEVTVEPLCGLAELEQNALVAGCAPLLGVLSQRTGLRCRDVRATWLCEHSGRALDLLDAGLVHVAGVHLFDEPSGQHNLPIVRRRFGKRRMLAINLTCFRQGLLVPKGNPQSIREPADLMRPGLRFARRESGSGAHALLSRLLNARGEPASRVSGPLARGHANVAMLVACGAADAGIAIESAAITAGLDFVPLSEERFDLVMPHEHAAEARVSRMLETLAESAFRREAARLPGYDHSLSGQTATLGAA